MKHTVKITLAAIVAVSAGMLSRAQAESLPKIARLVPPETVLLVNVDNFSQLKTQFEKTSFYKLYKDPVMAAFVEDAKTKWNAKIQKMDNEIAKAVVDANVLPQGKVAFALVLNKQAVDANEATALFITQWGENTVKIKEAVDKAAKKAVENGSHQKTEDYRGISIKTIIAQGSSRLGYGFSSKLSYCFIDDCLIGSEDIELLKFVIAHLKGASSPALADDSDYTATFGALGPNHDIDFYLNIKQFVGAIIARDTAGSIQIMMTNLGLDNAVAAGCSVGVAREPGGFSCGKAFLKVNGPKRGIFKILNVESAVLKAPRFVPASAYSVSLLNLNIKKVYDELYSILCSLNPMVAAEMQKPLLPPGPQGEPAVDLKTGIIDHLGSQIVIAQSVNKPFSNTGALPPTDSLVALAVNDRSALEKSLSLLHSKLVAPTNPEAKRELLGYTIYLISPRALPFMRVGVTPMQGPADMGPREMPKLAFTVTDTHLIFGVESTVERAIRTLSVGGTASVVSTKWFAAAETAIPSVVGLACLQDDAASSEMFWWMMKEAGEDKALNMPVNPTPGLVLSQAGGDLANFSLLPQFDAVRKYFGLSAFYGVSRPDGFFFEFRDFTQPVSK